MFDGFCFNPIAYELFGSICVFRHCFRSPLSIVVVVILIEKGHQSVPYDKFNLDYSTVLYSILQVSCVH